MNKFLLLTIKFIGFSIPVYILLLILWGEFISPNPLKKNLNYRIGSYGHMYSRIQELKSTRNIDILFLGSSHAYRGFDPRIFSRYGFTSFNLGSSAQTPLQTKVLLNRYLDQLNPKLIVFEVYPVVFALDGVESSLDIIANDTNDYESIKMAFSQNNIKVYNTLLYGFYRDWFQRDSSYEEPVSRDKDTYISGGYVETEARFSGEAILSEEKYILDNTQLAYFADIISYLREKNVPFVFVQAPVTKAQYELQTGNREFDEFIRSQGPYCNFNEVLNLDDELYFYDADHLTQDGVIIFNLNLIEAMMSNSGEKCPELGGQLVH